MKIKSKFRQAQILLCACFFSLNTLAQQYFDTLVDYNNNAEFPYSIYQVNDSGYIFITSGDTSIEFNKLDKYGNVVFQNIFGFLGKQLYVGFPNSLKPTFDGGWIFGGGSINASSANTNDGILVKYNSNGDTEFVKFMGDTSWETAYDCIQTSDSGFVIVGDKGKYSPNLNSDYWIVKTDINGNMLWERTIGTNKDEQAFTVIENDFHQLVVTGAKEYANPFHYPYVVIYDLLGNLISTKAFNSGALICAGGAIRRYNFNEYTLFGCLDSSLNMGDYSYPEYVARLDSNFNFKWMTIFNSPETKGIYIVKKISDNGIIIVGFKHDNTFGHPVGWIAKVDSNGNKLWEHYYAHNNNTAVPNYFSDFQETFDHGFIICGTTIGPTSQDSWLIKLDSNGCLDTSCGLNTGTIEIFNSPLALEMFPNPAREKVSIKYSLPSGEIGKLTIYTMLGKKIEDEILPKGSDQIEINIQQWAQGIYTCVIETGEKVFTGKLLKE